MRKDIKVVFMGTPEFARESLKELVESGYHVVACFTNPDKPSGRGMKLKYSSVKEYAIEKNIPVYQPNKVKKNQEVIDILNEMSPDFLVVVAYGKILPQEVLDIPRLGAINVHGSLLPKYRGSAPMQWAIINGEKITGITTMFMDSGMDTGDMLLKEEVEIQEKDNLEDIHDRLMVVGAKLLIKTLDGLLDGTVKGEKQPDGATYAPMIDREMTKIDFHKNARDIYNFVRGLCPFPGTYMELQNGKKYKVFQVEAVEDGSIDKSIENGSILLMSKNSLYIRCNDGYVKILQIQPENSKRMDISAFLAGNRLSIADIFV
ncbi:MAG: methionyl-tRNA formyltransferase [Clostridia bacterium]|nr:methionyl-tRNA formyltransferase [Clostridia bacterium]